MRFPVSRALCVETNAGRGTMSGYWSGVCDRVIAIDKDAGKLAAIDCPTVETLCAGNRSEEARRHWLDSEIVDCDPWGDPWWHIREILGRTRRKRVFIAFTDASWFTRRWNADGRRGIEQKLAELPRGVHHHYEQVKRGGVLYYGWIYCERSR